MKVQPSISVIVTTYNWPQALQAVLRSIINQSYVNLEVLVADDGSREETKQLIEKWAVKAPFPIRHIWQEDKGFRAAKIRNRAIAVAKNDFIVFLDGDCVVPPFFFHQYGKLAQKGCFVSGNRILLSQSFTQQYATKGVPFERWSLAKWLVHWWQGHCNRILPLIYFPLGPLRNKISQHWKGVKTCNLGVWREDLLAVNGLDEEYTGWGYEDSDLVIRLLRYGISRKEGRFAISVFHLWHPLQSRKDASENYALLASIQNEARIKALIGLDQYLPSQ